ncbi:molybdopterin converting factor subunit 1 [Thalassoglobus sp. JC818]|uniref:molybdopterin converting factor subunit 1 n=1 Tax=Thalassoglobus sp. JC818 TaxID=3232136 RepID=UPI00345A4F1F
MTVSVLLFARASELAGTSSTDLEFDENPTVAQFKVALTQRFPELELLSKQLLVAVNNNYVQDGDIIPDNAEVACFPPVSGG